MTALPSVLILDGRQRAALAIARSLGRHGVQVHSAEAGATFSLAARSRHVRAAHSYTSPATSATRFVADVQEILQHTGAQWVWPVTDATSTVLCAADLLTPRVLAASGAGYTAASDKARLSQRAAELGVPVPQTRYASDIAEVHAAAQAIGFPCVLKPARSRYLAGEGVRGTSVHVIKDPATLTAVLEQASWLPHMPALVQAFVPGHGEGVFCLFDGTDAVAWFAHRRLREKPPGGGVSVLSASAEPDPRLQAYARTLLADAGYRGIAMVEFRVTPAGEPYLMEINARPWGSLQLAIDAGVDFPWLFYCLMNGLPLPEVTLRPARLRWWLGDLDRLLLQLRRPIPGTSRLGTLASFALTCLDWRVRNEVLRLDDPGPGIAELGAWLRRE